MPAWNANNGTWGDPARWNGGVPDSASAVADFTIANAGAASRIISFAEGASFTIGSLIIVTDDNDGWIFRGQVDATVSTLRFQGAGGSPAFISVDTNGSSLPTFIDSSFGLRLSFVSDVFLTTANSDTSFRISAPIIGSGDLYKSGDGTLVLNGANSVWQGDLVLLGGRTEASIGGIGNARITLGNDALLATSGTLANRIQVNDDSDAPTIAAISGSTLVLSGLLISEAGNGSGLRFGSITDTGAIVLTGTSLVLGESGFTINSAVRFGNAGAAANYFATLPSSGALQIAGVLDTNGFAAVIDNLDLDGGTIAAGTGALDLTVVDTFSSANSQAGTIQGTAGADRIFVSAALAFNFSATTFTSWTSGVDTITIVGNANGNVLTGSAQIDAIDGGDGGDTLDGGGGADTLIGGAGTDLLTGGAGIDILYGGTGDDIYIGDGGDFIVEAVGAGNDIVYASASFALSIGQEIETLWTGNFNGLNVIDLTGNEFANTIWGNAAANVLTGNGGNDSLHGFGGVDGILGGDGNDFIDGGDNDDSLHGGDGGDTLIGGAGKDFLSGGAGVDVMYGGAGDDTYLVDAGDYVEEAVGAGNDIVYASSSFTLSAGMEIETLSAGDIAGTAAINLGGNERANTLLGNNGVNILNGGGGLDVLVGYGGNDIFAFATAAAAGNADTISDFVAGTDKIALDDALFSGIGAPGAFNAAAFVVGASAADGNDRIVYNSATGQLFYDADGNAAGAAVLIATLTGNPVLGASDFLVI